MVVHRRPLGDAEINVRRGFRVTSPLRTAADLGALRDQTEGVVFLDAALHSGMVTMQELDELIARSAGHKGVARLRRAAALADGASESPMETRVRLILDRAGLPPPVCQARLFDRAGRFIARVDLCYPSARLCIEYDGSTHRDSLREDDRRQNQLMDAGYRVLRFTAADLATPDRIVSLVRAALARPPAAGD